MSERVEIAFFHDIIGRMAAVGDQVAVAVASRRYTGLRIGELLKITGVFRDDAYRDIRVTVRVTTTTDGAGERYNTETRSWERQDYTFTYDAANRVVKL